MPKYDKEWWLENGLAWAEESHGKIPTKSVYKLQEDLLLETLAVLPFDSILEIGCGFGRITKRVANELYRDSYLATDVSQPLLDLTRDYLGDTPVGYQVFDLDQPPEFNGEHFDLILAVEVLMHRTSDQVCRDIANLSLLSSKYIVNVDWFDPTSTKEAEGCYQHDYVDLFNRYVGRSTTNRIQIPGVKQAIWVTELT